MSRLNADLMDEVDEGTNDVVLRKNVMIQEVSPPRSKMRE